MARDVLRRSCMCASGEPHVHAGPIQSEDGRRGSFLRGDPWRRGFEKSQGRARRGGEGSAALLARFEPELERERPAAAEAIASGTPP